MGRIKIYKIKKSDFLSSWVSNDVAGNNIVSEEIWGLLDDEKSSFPLASLKILSGLETPECRGDEGFSRVPIYLEATVTFYR